MTDLYEPKAPFRAIGATVLDAKDACIAEAVSSRPSWYDKHQTRRRIAARITAALNAQERVKELEGALHTAIAAIASLDPEALGIAEDHQTGALAYPIRDALLHNLREARNLTGDTTND